MGLNVNLCEMFGLPKKQVCPNCKKESPTRFDDFDIEADEPRKGVMTTHAYCHHCEHEWKIKIIFSHQIIEIS